MRSSLLSRALRLAGLLVVGGLAGACAAAPITPPLAEAEALPEDVPPLRARRWHPGRCDCPRGLVCCNDVCGICAPPTEICAPVGCQ